VVLIKIEMRKLGKIVVWFFAVLGLLSAVLKCYAFWGSQNDAAAYRKNCVNVSIGMSVSEAKKLMGDYNWFEKNIRSEIWIESGTDSTQKFYLNYPGSFGTSSSPMIYFDPNTMKVINVICGE
jgi:hypothetical protein